MPVLQEYKCPQCGGDVEFNPGVQKMKCPWCDTEFDPEAMEKMSREENEHDQMDWEEAPSDTWQEGEAESFVCQSCGGEIITDSTTSATVCPWCSGPVIMKGNVSGALKPDYVIPFKLTRDNAKEALKRHVSSKKLVPKVFLSENRIEEIRGVYVPFWIFDADVSGSASYRATTVRMWIRGEWRITETCHYSVRRGGDMSFRAIPVDGSSKLANDITESIEPFDLNEAKPFSTAYLSGFLADKYDVEADSCIPRVNDRVKKSMEDALRSTVIGYSSVMPEHSSVKLSNTRVKYVLFPVWFLNTRWQDKTYTFAMNAQTGRFVGDLPLDKKAWWKWFLGVSLSSSAVLGVLSYLFWFFGT